MKKLLLPLLLLPLLTFGIDSDMKEKRKYYARELRDYNRDIDVFLSENMEELKKISPNFEDLITPKKLVPKGKEKEYKYSNYISVLSSPFEGEEIEYVLEYIFKDSFTPDTKEIDRLLKVNENYKNLLREHKDDFIKKSSLKYYVFHIKMLNLEKELLYKLTDIYW